MDMTTETLDDWLRAQPQSWDRRHRSIQSVPAYPIDPFVSWLDDFQISQSHPRRSHESRRCVLLTGRPLSLGKETQSGRLHLSIPVSNCPVDYEEYYELTPDE